LTAMTAPMKTSVHEPGASRYVPDESAGSNVWRDERVNGFAEGLTQNCD
jgi:hypothetical protein